MNITRKWKTALALLAVFVAGAGIGSAMTVWGIQRAFRRGMNPDHWVASTMARLDSKLNLSPEQESRVKPLLEDSARQFAAAFHRFLDDGGRVLSDFNVRLDATLTPEQRVMHGEMVREMKDKMHEFSNRLRDGD